MRVSPGVTEVLKEIGSSGLSISERTECLQIYKNYAWIGDQLTRAMGDLYYIFFMLQLITLIHRTIMGTISQDLFVLPF